ncbi:unnamed protein product [Tuber melanosporum]|uniref:(Perigord truffle) hypothetical protein n=1 Tax=Tuber melanosporum (strain Mel28) TaxID=656061 RepID=D5GC78_TUBMM|nr:uncharacterized protein GSTUM_00000630001 [Tuber melanosporum]CAZ82121.1 unnamed protein product [Tuber melanosporum]
MKISWPNYSSSYGIAGITIATGGLIIGWAFPAAIVDLVSQIDSHGNGLMAELD